MLKHSNLYSHCGKLIEDHVANVINLSMQNAKFLTEDLKKLSFITAFTHDIGKTTSYFQDYLRNSCDGKKHKKDDLTNHSLLGGVAGLYIADKIFKDDFYKALCFIIPKRHHGNLKDIFNDIVLSKDNDGAFDILIKQVNSIDRDNFYIFLNNLKANLNFKDYNYILDLFELEDFKDFLSKSLEKRLKDLKLFMLRFIRTSNLESFLETILSYSILINSDKSDAGAGQNITKIQEKDISFTPDIVKNYMKKLDGGKSNINDIRAKAFDEIYNQQIDLDKKIYSLTLPTGTGKTLLSILFAFKLHQKLKQEKGITPKIIYSLPFLSIVEQNYSVLEGVLKEHFKEVTTDILLKHHHLSEISYKSQEDEYDFETSRVLVEGWESAIIVTTFMQFFYSIFSNKNSMLRKFSNLQNAIVILDEIQSIPVKYWNIINDTFLNMAKKSNFYVVLSTATQPMIFNTTEDLVNHKEFFDAFNRYTIHIDLNKKTIDELLENIDLSQDKSYMFVMNTIESSKSLFRKIDELGKLHGKEVYYLSTSVVPKERRQRLTEIKKKLENGQKIILISTQLVEAGVDVDFDIVYRDLAPLDSIVQSAGRCNRNYNIQKGLVYMIQLKDDQNRPYHSIYDEVLIDATKDILKDKDVVEEKEIFDLINEYYEKLKNRKAQDNKLLEAIKRLKFDGTKDEVSISNFELIKEQPYKSDVFVELDDEAKLVWKNIEEIINIKDVFERKKEFTKIKPKFYDYVASVDVRNNTPEFKYFIYFVGYDSLLLFYDKSTGFRNKGDDFIGL